MLSLWLSPTAPLQADAQVFPFQPSPLYFLQKYFRIVGIGAQTTTAIGV
jgi:hypothetical protein